jgi:DNA-binding MarR family transcriptional regulator
MFLGLRVNELIVERGRGAGFAGLRESHGFVIQHLIDADRTITELADRMAVTQQAASKTVADMQALGIVDIVRTEDRRERRVRLSKQGWKGVQLARRARRDIDARLSRAVGQKRYGAAKAVILDCLDVLGGVERIRTRRIRPPA